MIGMSPASPPLDFGCDLSAFQKRRIPIDEAINDRGTTGQLMGTLDRKTGVFVGTFRIISKPGDILLEF